jgi:hypothetical protein
MTGLLMVTMAMLVLAAGMGAVYAYTQRSGSPYGPRVQDYLGNQAVEPEDDEHARAA